MPWPDGTINTPNGPLHVMAAIGQILDLAGNATPPAMDPARRFLLGRQAGLLLLRAYASDRTDAQLLAVVEDAWTKAQAGLWSDVSLSVDDGELFSELL